MRNLNKYITEKLHLNSDNKKNLVVTDDNVELFLDNLENNEIRRHVVELFNFCLSYIRDHRNPKDKVCYILRNNYRVGTKQYLWAQNIYSTPLEIGDNFNDDDRTKVIFVVTENTKIPEKYKKYLP